MSFAHGAILFGLFALIIPPIVHLLNRRRYDVVEWAAMQFLQISRKVRRKIVFEQLLLMLLRAALIATLVLAVASPVIDLSCVGKLPFGERLVNAAGHSNRDIVLIVDGSYSMDCRWNEKTAHDEARAWAGQFIDGLSAGDRVAVFQAKQRPIPVLPLLTGDHSEVKTKIEQMPRPRGGVDWARAVQEALRILETGTNPQREIIILTDGQRQGWADPKSLENWELLAHGLPADTTLPRIWVVNVVPGRPADLPNWFVGKIESNRAVATLNREVKFKFELHAAIDSNKAEGDKKDGAVPGEGPKFSPPTSVQLHVDGRPAGDRPVPSIAAPAIGMEFTQRFTTTGSHLVGVTIGADALLGDNHRDFAFEVLPAIPVVMVDGNPRAPAEERSAHYIRRAIAPENDSQPSFLLRTITATEFASQSLVSPVTRDPATLPRVLILANAYDLTDEQNKAIEEFLQRGGSVLVVPGSRCATQTFNEFAFREGQGWLPARLGKPKDAPDGKEPKPDPEDLKNHPALELFKESGRGDFLTAKFPHWWDMDASLPGAGNVIARLSNGDPLLVEKAAGKGRVILSAVPIDRSWNSTLPTLGETVVLCQELLYYLAGARTAELNLDARQPIVFWPHDGEPPGGVTIEIPEGPPRRQETSSWPLIFSDTLETGVYKLTTDSGKVQYYVVQPDTNESFLRPCEEKDCRAVQSFFPEGRFLYETDRGRIMEAFRKGENNPHLWWLFLLAVIALLAGEVAYTRHLVKKSPPVTED
jgi:hypothetical protein